MDNHQNIGKMLEGARLIKDGIPQAYEFLPRGEFYRLKQLFDELETIPNKHK
ncbi:MAG: hypothetical protein KGH71_04425 [Candidatus Micrarchaeota archaeon]|nr:hypothetical protein [Candidatus Micrarchaeota archaeon]